MEGQQLRGRSPSAGRHSNERLRHSPSPQNFHHQSPPTDLNAQNTSTNFPSQPFNSNLSPTSSPGIHYNLPPSYLNNSPQRTSYQQHVLPSNDFGDQSFRQPYQQSGLDPSFQQDSTHISPNTSTNSFPTEALGLETNFGDFSRPHELIEKPRNSFEHSFMVDPQLQAGLHQQGSINPADIMSNMSSPQNLVPTPPNLMPPDNHHSSGPTSPVANQGQQWSPNHSRHASLDPSAAFTNGQQPTEWAGMLSGSQFQTHRRAPSEHSDVSSSVAPSPFMAQQDTFDAFDQSPSPMLNAQQDGQLYQESLGIEQFSLSEPQQHRSSPRHSPYVSPRMSPQPGLGLAQESNFITLQNPNHNFNGGPGSEIFTHPAESFPPFQPEERLGSNDMGQAAQMVPPEINVEYAPPTRQPNFEPPRFENNIDALSPPDRGMNLHS